MDSFCIHVWNYLWNACIFGLSLGPIAVTHTNTYTGRDNKKIVSDSLNNIFAHFLSLNIVMTRNGFRQIIWSEFSWNLIGLNISIFFLKPKPKTMKYISISEYTCQSPHVSLPCSRYCDMSMFSFSPTSCENIENSTICVDISIDHVELVYDMHGKHVYRYFADEGERSKCVAQKNWNFKFHYEHTHKQKWARRTNGLFYDKEWQGQNRKLIELRKLNYWWRESQ